VQPVGAAPFAQFLSKPLKSYPVLAVAIPGRTFNINF
jgi:hypothetical protein